MECDVIITYCWNRVGYNILKSLANKGLKVVVADTSKCNICSLSKYSSGSFTYPDPFSHEKEFVNCLIDKINVLKPSILIPTHDESIIIAKHRDQFPENLIIPIETEKKLIDLSDKIKASLIAKKAKVPTPIIYSNISKISKYPIVFKTAIGNSAKGVFFPKNESELRELQLKFQDTKTFVQEYCEGVDFCVDCIRYGDFFYASVYKALITKTEGGGTTTQRIIVENNRLITYAKQFLDYVDYNGVCGLDFKVNADNNVYFIECNARYTGGLATPIAAGFDIPYIHYTLATTGVFNKNINLKVGTKTKWILGDIITFVGRIISLKFDFKEMKQIFKFKFDAFDDFCKDDKKAIIGELAYYFHKLIKNRKLNP